MLVQTKHFGEIDLSENKIITFDNGIMGFEEYKRYTILYDSSKEEEGRRPAISWLQCLDLKELALPVINPILVKPDYNPYVEDELLNGLGELTEENLAIFLTMTIPSDITKMTSNLKAPIVINADTRKGCQIIAENPDYAVRYPVYDQFKKAQDEKEGGAC